ncbi:MULTISPECIES: hypothetical protein [unclassified Variovorax]|uniref:hypothetical protein n=1 Tax=unclassified Variovorax TaxID=663243 RepID=UPI000A3E7A07|nr:MULTISPECIES: hypothetical protein [unclassified Variovorax]
MNRRSLLSAAAALASFSPLLFGYSMVDKKNIRSFGKTYDYLRDPALRQKETGNSQLLVDGAEVSGANFHDVAWHNIKFVKCDFVGGYEIKLSELRNCIFENCRFAGIINWGIATSIRFVRCQAGGQSNVIDFSGSSDIRFETCVFVGTDPNPNNWGGIGSRGDATFVDCKAKWFDLAGYKQIVMDRCETQDVGIWTDSAANSGTSHESAVVVIKHSKLRGSFGMVASDLQSLTLHDTVLENLDLRDATVKGNVVMERIKGGYINAYVKQAGGLRIRNSQILGNGRKIFEAYAGGIQSIEIDTVVFGGDLSSEPVTIAGGFSLKSFDRISNISQSIDIRNSTIPTLDASYLHTQRLVLKDNQIMRANMSNSRVADLEISGTRITGKLDFHGTQAAQQKVDLSAGSTFGRVDQMDGSNIRLQPRSAR